MDNNNDKAITFDDIEFNKNSRLGKRGIVHFSNGLQASIIKLNEQFSQKFDAEYKMSILNVHGVPLDTDLCSSTETLSAIDTEELNELLKKAQKLDENGKLPSIIDELEFTEYNSSPFFSKKASLSFEYGSRVSILEYSPEEQERHGCKYAVILRYENYPFYLDLEDKSEAYIARVTTDQKLIEVLKLADTIDFYHSCIDSGCYRNEYDKCWKEYKNLVEKIECNRDEANKEKEFITWDDLKFEQYDSTIPEREHAWAHFDMGALHIIRKHGKHGYSYDLMDYAADYEYLGDAYYVTNDNKVFLNRLLQEKQRGYKNGISPVEEDFIPHKTLTLDDLKFDSCSVGKKARVELDTGLIVHIDKLDKEMCKNDSDKKFAELATEHMYRIYFYDYHGYLIDDSQQPINDIGNNDEKYGLFLKDDTDLNKALKKICLLDRHGKLPEEKTETTKSTEKEDRAKQSAERIRAKKKSVSGVYVADKIAEAMRSGVISEPVTPEKGKQLSDNIKKKYIMDQMQKS